MKRLIGAFAAVAASAVLMPLPSAQAQAQALPEVGVVKDAAGDVIGSFEDSRTIDIRKVAGWRTGGYLFGRMTVANVRTGTPRQQFVLWVKAPDGTVYRSTVRNGRLDEAPTRLGAQRSRCSLGSVTLGWNTVAETVTWKMPMSCFREHPRGWRVAGASSIGGGKAWDQTGGRRPTEWSPLFANTP